MVKRKRTGSGDTFTDTDPKSKLSHKARTLDNVPEQVDFSSSVSAAEEQLRKVMDDFVKVYERLDQSDDPTTKPNYSYSELVFLAILRSPNFCLPITEIYKYVKSRFAFFRSSAREHWKNAVRHSLSKTKCFTKISVGRGVSVTGRLHKATYLWCIVPSSIVNFARGDYRPNVDKESGTNTLQWGYYRVNAGQFWGQVAIYLEKKMENFRKSISESKTPGKIFEAQICRTPEGSDDVTTPENFFSSGQLSSSANQDVQQSRDKVVPLPKHSIQHMLSESPKYDNKSAHDSGISLYHPNDTSQLSSAESSELSMSISPMNSLDQMTFHSLYSSFTSTFNSTSADLARNELDKSTTPELPDLGDVSPFSLSPIPPMENDSLIGTLQNYPTQSVSPPFTGSRNVLAPSLSPPFSVTPTSLAHYAAPSIPYYHSSPYSSYFSNYNPYPSGLDSSPYYVPGPEIGYPMAGHGSDPVLPSVGDYSF